MDPSYHKRSGWKQRNHNKSKKGGGNMQNCEKIIVPPSIPFNERKQAIGKLRSNGSSRSTNIFPPIDWHILGDWYKALHKCLEWFTYNNNKSVGRKFVLIKWCCIHYSYNSLIPDKADWPVLNYLVDIPASTRHWIIVGSMLGQRRRRWTSIKPTMV